MIWNTVGLLASCTMLWVSLWQIEICTGWDTDEAGFQPPFFPKMNVNRWWARDFWYAVNVASWVLAIICGGR